MRLETPSIMAKASSLFTRFAKSTSHYAGTPAVFGSAVAIVVIWAFTGPLFDYSDTWQLVINTGTTIITFLMVFLIQNTQNRDSQAVQVKLDELIKSHGKADNSLLDLEELEEEDMQELRDQYECLARKKRGEPEQKVDKGQGKA